MDLVLGGGAAAAAAAQRGSAQRHQRREYAAQLLAQAESDRERRLRARNPQLPSLREREQQQQQQQQKQDDGRAPALVGPPRRPAADKTRPQRPIQNQNQNQIPSPEPEPGVRELRDQLRSLQREVASLHTIEDRCTRGALKLYQEFTGRVTASASAAASTENKLSEQLAVIQGAMAEQADSHRQHMVELSTALQAAEARAEGLVGSSRHSDRERRAEVDHRIEAMNAQMVRMQQALSAEATERSRLETRLQAATAALETEISKSETHAEMRIVEQQSHAQANESEARQAEARQLMLFQQAQQSQYAALVQRCNQLQAALEGEHAARLAAEEELRNETLGVSRGLEDRLFLELRQKAAELSDHRAELQRVLLGRIDDADTKTSQRLKVVTHELQGLARGVQDVQEHAAQRTAALEGVLRAEIKARFGSSSTVSEELAAIHAEMRQLHGEVGQARDAAASDSAEARRFAGDLVTAASAGLQKEWALYRRQTDAANEDAAAALRAEADELQESVSAMSMRVDVSTSTLRRLRCDFVASVADQGEALATAANKARSETEATRAALTEAMEAERQQRAEHHGQLTQQVEADVQRLSDALALETANLTALLKREEGAREETDQLVSDLRSRIESLVADVHATSTALETMVKQDERRQSAALVEAMKTLVATQEEHRTQLLSTVESSLDGIRGEVASDFGSHRAATERALAEGKAEFSRRWKSDLQKVTESVEAARTGLVELAESTTERLEALRLSTTDECTQRCAADRALAEANLSAEHVFSTKARLELAAKLEEDLCGHVGHMEETAAGLREELADHKVGTMHVYQRMADSMAADVQAVADRNELRVAVDALVSAVVEGEQEDREAAHAQQLELKVRMELDEYARRVEAAEGEVEAHKAQVEVQVAAINERARVGEEALSAHAEAEEAARRAEDAALAERLDQHQTHLEAADEAADHDRAVAKASLLATADDMTERADQGEVDLTMVLLLQRVVAQAESDEQQQAYARLDGRLTGRVSDLHDRVTAAEALVGGHIEHCTIDRAEDRAMLSAVEAARVRQDEARRAERADIEAARVRDREEVEAALEAHVGQTTAVLAEAETLRLAVQGALVSTEAEVARVAAERDVADAVREMVDTVSAAALEERTDEALALSAAREAAHRAIQSSHVDRVVAQMQTLDAEWQETRALDVAALSSVQEARQRSEEARIRDAQAVQLLTQEMRSYAVVLEETVEDVEERMDALRAERAVADVLRWTVDTVSLDAEREELSSALSGTVQQLTQERVAMEFALSQRLSTVEGTLAERGAQLQLQREEDAATLATLEDARRRQEHRFATFSEKVTAQRVADHEQVQEVTDVARGTSVQLRLEFKRLQEDIDALKTAKDVGSAMADVVNGVEAAAELQALRERVEALQETAEAVPDMRVALARAESDLAELYQLRTLGAELSAELEERLHASTAGIEGRIARAATAAEEAGQQLEETGRQLEEVQAQLAELRGKQLGSAEEEEQVAAQISRVAVLQGQLQERVEALEAAPSPSPAPSPAPAPAPAPSSSSASPAPSPSPEADEGAGAEGGGEGAGEGAGEGEAEPKPEAGEA